MESPRKAIFSPDLTAISAETEAVNMRAPETKANATEDIFKGEGGIQSV